MKTKNLKFARMMAILVIIGMSVSSKAQIGNWLYVYSNNGAEQSFALDNLNKITFSEQGINLHPVSGNVKDLSYDNVSAMTFKSKATAIDMTKISNVKIYWETNNLIIESDMEMTAVKLYNIQGKLLTNQTLQSLSANIPLSSCPTGVYIVQVLDKHGVSIYKTIKR